jgi:hypothetical protein
MGRVCRDDADWSDYLDSLCGTATSESDYRETPGTQIEGWMPSRCQPFLERDGFDTREPFDRNDHRGR